MCFDRKIAPFLFALIAALWLAAAIPGADPRLAGAGAASPGRIAFDIPDRPAKVAVATSVLLNDQTGDPDDDDVAAGRVKPRSPAVAAIAPAQAYAVQASVRRAFLQLSTGPPGV